MALCPDSLPRVGMRLLACAALLSTFPASAQVCSRPGNDGNGTPSGVVNTYYPVAFNAIYDASSTSIALGARRGAPVPLREGDLVLVLQVQCDDIDPVNSDAYGDGTPGEPASGALATPSNCRAGRHEFVRAGPGTSNTRLGLEGSPLRQRYGQGDATPSSGRRTLQVVRVPQYANATLSGTVRAAPWDGTSGGVVALDVALTLDLSGFGIDVDGAGFRGGGGRAIAAQPTTTVPAFRWDDASRFGSKGEGTAGTPRFVSDQRSPDDGTTLPDVIDLAPWWGGYPTGVGRSGDAGRGAPANAGGGGAFASADADNAGGGGGGNGGAGGRGGAGYRVVGWGGVLPDYTNLVERLWGFGGAAVRAPAIDALVFGGGGGAGDSNGNDLGERASGGAGGGLILVRAGTLRGVGRLSARGARAPDNGGDGAGGGGAGGSVVVVATQWTATLTVDARGGRGGDAAVDAPFAHGVGGGGGGGVVVTTGPVLVDVSAGDSGRTSVDDGAPGGARHGGEPGSEGVAARIDPADDTVGRDVGRTCLADLELTKTNTPGVQGEADAADDAVQAGVPFDYVITVRNLGPRAAGGAVVRDPATAGLVCSAVACASSGGATCPAGSSDQLLQDLRGTGAVVPQLPVGGRVVLTLTCVVP